MTRCSAKTLSGKRCKNSGTHCGVCLAHVKLFITPDNDPETAPTGEKRCGHCCSLERIFCCSCSDLRPLDTTYYRYVDTIGELPIGMRHDGYCPDCQKREVPQTFSDKRFKVLTDAYTGTVRGLIETLSMFPKDTIAVIVEQALKLKEARDH